MQSLRGAETPMTQSLEKDRKAQGKSKIQTSSKRQWSLKNLAD